MLPAFCKVALDLCLAVMWFLASQLVTAALSGAFGEEAKERYLHFVHPDVTRRQ